jgi:hypothetical protein
MAASAASTPSGLALTDASASAFTASAMRAVYGDSMGSTVTISGQGVCQFDQGRLVEFTCERSPEPAPGHSDLSRVIRACRGCFTDVTRFRIVHTRALA